MTASINEHNKRLQAGFGNECSNPYSIPVRPETYGAWLQQDTDVNKSKRNTGHPQKKRYVSDHNYSIYVEQNILDDIQPAIKCINVKRC